MEIIVDNIENILLFIFENCARVLGDFVRNIITIDEIGF